MYSDKAEYFNKTASAPWSGDEYGPGEMARLERLFKITGPLKGCRILEPGCGTGRLTEILSDRVGRKGRVVALDISPVMIREARRRNGSRQNVDVHLCTVEAFRPEEKSFGIIMCHQVFPHFADKKNVLDLLSCAMKDDGRFLVHHFIDFKAINDHHRKAGTAVEKDMMPGHDRMRRMFYKAGLRVEFLLDDDMGYFLAASRKCLKQ